MLEDHDAQTQEGISQLLTDVLSNSLEETFLSIEDVVDFADRYPERFCELLDRNCLFVAPGGAVNESLEEALRRYEREMTTWRSREWLDAYGRLPVHRRLLNGVLERVGPVYHLLENAQEFEGHPLMCLEQHAHYFRLVSHTSSARLSETRNARSTNHGFSRGPGFPPASMAGRHPS